MNKGVDNQEMHKRRITLADGRYMIFYTFGEDEPQAVTKDEREAAEPEAVPHSKEERGV